MRGCPFWDTPGCTPLMERVIVTITPTNMRRLTIPLLSPMGIRTVASTRGTLLLHQRMRSQNRHRFRIGRRRPRMIMTTA